ncbi:MAG: hypothetical protein ACREFN_14060, partial [Acetobacteraceae bacterium]
MSMADSRRWLRRARRAFARIQQFRPLQVPDAPAQAAHDPWPGDAARGARMVKGELDVAGTIRAVRPGTWN